MAFATPTTATTPASPAAREARPRPGTAVAVLILIGGAVAVRRGLDGWPGATSPVAAAWFAALLTLVWLAGRRLLGPSGDVTRSALPVAVGVGAAGAALLLLGPAVLRLMTDDAPLDPTLPVAWFPAWAMVVTAVAVTEELVLRGTLWAALARAGAGPVPVVCVTTVAFALLHVPFYGWGSVPVNLAAGLVLGGVRLATGSLVAPATTHTLADLGGWFLV